GRPRRPSPSRAPPARGPGRGRRPRKRRSPPSASRRKHKAVSWRPRGIIRTRNDRPSNPPTTMVLAEQSTAANADFWSAHSGEAMILVLFALVVLALLMLVPQLVRAHMRKAEMLHEEHLKALDHGVVIQPPDEPAKAAGRTAMLVPMVVVI